MLAERRPVIDDVVAEAQARHIGRKQAFQSRLAIYQRQLRNAFSVEEQKVESKEDKIARAAFVHGDLQAAERGDAVRPDSAQLPVDIGVFHRERAQGRYRRSIAMRPIEAGAGEQADVAAVDPRVHAVSVVLDFVKPIGAVGRFVDQPRQLRLGPFRRMRFIRLCGVHRLPRQLR
ncbi:hypothetical protein NKH79_25290 [Mesorhizobium sp. M0977]